MRQAVGVAVFFGMIGVTLFGLVFTPIFYVIVRNLADGKAQEAGRGVGRTVAFRRIGASRCAMAQPGIDITFPILLADPKWMGRCGVIE